jgi:hypothetical protein
MKWFFCLNDGPWQFELAQVAVQSARTYTKFDPVCIYDGNEERVLDWMEVQKVPVIRHTSKLAEYACSVYDVPVNHPRSIKLRGVWLRIDIPTLTDDEFVLYTDTDVMFQADCAELHNVKPDLIALCNDFNPYNSYNTNSGVLLMNVPALRAEYDEFVGWIKKNMQRGWTVYDQHAYDQCYGHRAFRLPLEFNWKSFWEQDYAVCDPNIRVQRARPVQIVHFTGNKPYDNTRYKEGMGLYRGPNNYPWQKKWQEIYEQVKKQEENKIPTPTGSLYPYHVFSNKTLVENTFDLERLIYEFGVHSDSSTDCPLTGLQIVQQPNQFANFLHWMWEQRDEIDSYMEVGVHFGGAFYVVDSFMRSVSPKFGKSVAVDILRHMQDWNRYSAKFPVEFVHSNSLDYTPSQTFGLIFLDTIHSYDHVMAEYNHYKPFAKYIAIHDICGFKEAGMDRAWAEIKSKHIHWEFTEQHKISGMGIGVVKI